ncbi:hypothetical protein DEU56DRAFT_862132 [Suillus clintonianus]|uniref:uncharacterized protein n=1 Tax=Suillus clintonianus TaxID=1904413 RepID=UPI001B8839DC|nr:uncharacterized protein DEU56DRAFT_862132 [Suillus clintonianus]KAG2126585.1 hypothetical protein DEU56DRAFT_862132 [Suillus clintonianus]
MFKFIRRVSTSFLPRPDRPWRDDATSNAPTIGRKRRFSFVEDDDDNSTSTGVKKLKGDSTQAEGSTPPIPAVPDQKEGEDVKSVTQGVKDVELDGTIQELDSSSGPEEIPLPDSPGGAPQPDIKSTEEAATAPEGKADKQGAQDNSDADSVASSSEVVLDEGQPEDDSKDDTKTSPTSAAACLPVEDVPTTEGTPAADVTPALTETDV